LDKEDDAIMVQINSSSVDELDYLSVLECEVRLLHDRLQPHDTGHLHTTIGVLKERIEEVKEQIRANIHAA